MSYATLKGKIEQLIEKARNAPPISGDNLVDQSAYTKNAYLNNNGVVTSYNGWSITDYIPLEVGKRYLVSSSLFSSAIENYCYFFKSDKTFLKKTNISDFEIDAMYSYLIVPQDASYARFSDDDNKTKNYRMYKVAT